MKRNKKTEISLPEGRRFFTCEKEFGKVFAKKIEGVIEKDERKIFYVLRIPEFEAEGFEKINAVFAEAAAGFLAFLEKKKPDPENTYASLSFELSEENGQFLVRIFSYIGNFQDRALVKRHTLAFSPAGEFTVVKSTGAKRRLFPPGPSGERGYPATQNRRKGRRPRPPLRPSRSRRGSRA